MPPPAVVIEVVSPGPENRNRDYVAKYREYLMRRIPEYWIIDPIDLQVTVCSLVENYYQQVVFRGNEEICSTTFPTLSLTAQQVFSAGSSISLA